MNYLAHCWLYPDSAATLAGSLFGDLVHGCDLGYLPPVIEDAIRLHRLLDRVTDAQPAVVALKQDIAPRFRRYAGILFDMAFDHILARDFALWHDEPLRVFADRVYAAIGEYSPLLPAERQPRLQYIVRHDLLYGYRDYGNVLLALRGIGGRLRRANPLAEAEVALPPLWPQLESTAPELFHELCAQVAQWRQLPRLARIQPTPEQTQVQ